MHHTSGQIRLTAYFPILDSIDSVLSKKDDLIDSLSAYCKELIEEKENSGTKLENLSVLLRILLTTAQENCNKHKNGHRYEDIKEFAAYTFLTAGRMFYEMIQANLPDSLPTISVVEKYIATNSHPVHEGVFYFKECKEFLVSRDLPLKVGFAEDGTVLKQGFKYDRRTNLVVGSVLPLLNGIPVSDAFPANSAALIAKHYASNDLAKIAYVYMVQPLKMSAPPFCLGVFGTDNKFTAEDCSYRKDFIVKGLADQDVEVVFWGSDGDQRLLKAMRAEIFPLNAVVPAGFEDWFFGDTSVGPTPVQDPIHLLNRFKTRLLKPSVVLPMGHFVVSSAHLKTIIKFESKAEHGLTDHDLSKQDKMNFDATAKICSERAAKSIEKHVPGSDATLVYLELMRKVQSGFLDPSLTPLERVYNLWYVIGFLRIWKNWIVMSKYTVGDNFITQNMYVGLEINAHSLIKLMRFLRDTKCDHLFLVSLLGSQVCERFFCKTRLTTSTESFKMNYTMYELLHIVKRIEFLLEISCKMSQQFKFPRERRRALLQNVVSFGVPAEPLPWDAEIKTMVMAAFSDATIAAGKLGMRAGDISLSTQLGSVLNCEIEEDENEEEEGIEQVQDLDDDIPLDILAAFSTGTPSALDLSTVKACVATADQEIPPDSIYVCFKDNKGVTRVLLKTTFCWLLQTEGFQISNDRLERCKTQVAVQRRRLLSHPRVESVHFKNEVSVGDFCIFKIRSKLVIAQVLSFSYLSGKNKAFSLDVAPTQAPARGARGLGCLCNIFNVINSYIVQCKFDFVNMTNYKVSIPSPAPSLEGHLVVHKDVLKYIS